MKTFNISECDLDTLFSKLWEECQDRGYFKVMPDKNEIEVYGYIDNIGTSALVAKINIVEINDAYEIKDNLFN